MILPILVSLLALNATAALPDPVLSSAQNPGTGTLLLSPAGIGPSLASAGLTVTVQLLDAVGDPIPQVPAQDIWLVASDGGLFLCENGSTADAATDADGLTTISGAIAGGGTSFDGAQVVACGVLLAGPVLPITFVSPDYTGDLRVDIVDLAFYLAEDYANGTYDARSDFNADGRESLPDVAIFAARNGESCP